MIATTTLALELLLRSTLLLAILLLVTWLLWGRAPALTATVQSFALPGLLLLPVLTVLGPTWPWRVLPVRGEEREPARKRLVRVEARPPLGAAGVARGPRAVEHASASAAPDRRAGAARAPGSLRVPPITAGAMVVVIYTTGCLIVLVRIALGLGSLRRLIAGSTPLESPQWTGELERWRAVLHLRRTVGLVASASASMPLTLPWWRPVIVIPETLERTATADQRRAAILHELIHVQRSDPAWNLLLRIVEAVYWFHPLMWLLSRSIAATRELVCDSVCARHLGTESYTGALIELAGRLKRSPRLTLGLAMARTSRLGRRLRALSQAGPRQRSRLRPAQAAAVAVPVVLLVLGSAAIRPVAAVVPQAASASNGQSPEAPVAVSGRLIDVQGEPFREIELKVEIMNSVPGPAQDERTSERRLKTDREGRFSFEIVPEPRPDAMTQFNFHGDGFMPYTAGGFSRADLRKGSLGDLATQRRFLQRGRVLDPSGQPVAGARVLAVPEVDKQSTHEGFDHLFEQAETDRSGRFAVHLPRERDVGVMVRSDRGAIARLVVPAGEELPAEIRLQRGMDLVGRVLDRSGRPVPGCVVAAESPDVEAAPTSGFDFLGRLRIRAHCVSDAEGRFRFRPLLGVFVVSVKNRDDVLEKDSEAYHRAIDPPPMIPVTVHLDAPGEKGITLTEAPSATVQGTVRWQDGRPAAGVSFYPQCTPEGASACDLVTTDKDGHYALRLPLPLEDVLLLAQPYTGPDGNGTAIWPVDPKHRKSRNDPALLRIHPLDGPRQGLDWVIVPFGERPGGERAQAAEPDAGDVGAAPELLALEREIGAANQAQAAGLNPNPDLIRRCLEFEAQHRGTRAGLGALHHVMVIGAQSLIDSKDDPRARVVPILRDHYLAHPDLDMMLAEFNAAFPLGDAEPLMQKIAAESPHDSVRAAALYELAMFNLNMNALLHPHPDSGLKVEGPVPDKDFGKEGRRLLEEVVARFPDARGPQRSWDGPQFIRIVDVAQPYGRSWSHTEMAGFWLFRLTQLGIGQHAPALEGTDPYYRPVRLSDFAGKVVVLTFTIGGDADRTVYDRCKRLMGELQARPFVCLSVVPDNGLGPGSARSIVRTMGITWPVIREEPGGPLVSRWCQIPLGTPNSAEVFVIDQRGIIRHHEPDNPTFEVMSDALTQKVRALCPVDPGGLPRGAR